ncbi:MAG: pyridoxine 5'-phosphate synthase [Myxococcota bacterium]
MVQLSVNINKVATLRNSRGGQVPSLLRAVEVCVDAGVPGITVHPREDARHITEQDVRDVAKGLEPHRGVVEYNIEGDPRPGLVRLVEEVRPDQCTLVPVRPGELTSEAGWPSDTPQVELRTIIDRFRKIGVRVSLFIEARDDAIAWAADLGADRVELYTEPYARAFEQGAQARDASLARYAAASRYAHARGLGINAGHDLDLENLPAFVTLPHLDEVSIGHALISRGLFVGLEKVVSEYLQITSR